MHAKIYLCWKVQNNLITLLTFYTTAHKSGCIMVWAETSVILTQLYRVHYLSKLNAVFNEFLNEQ